MPSSLREAAAALGAPQWKVIVMVTYRAAIQGMLTGVLLAVARISGETAPLLFTALNNQFWSTNLNAPMANLPVVIFQFAMSPYADWQTLAWGGALLITVTILLLNIVARMLASWSSLRNDHRASPVDRRRRQRRSDRLAGADRAGAASRRRRVGEPVRAKVVIKDRALLSTASFRR